MVVGRCYWTCVGSSGAFSFRACSEVVLAGVKPRRRAKMRAQNCTNRVLTAALCSGKLNHS
jgi:hypothetical protein